VRACGLTAWHLSQLGRGCTSLLAVAPSLASLLRTGAVIAESIAIPRQHQTWPRMFQQTLSVNRSRISRSLGRPRVLTPLAMQGSVTAMGRGCSSPKFQKKSPTAYSPRWALHVDFVSVLAAVAAGKEERKPHALSSSTVSKKAQDQRFPGLAAFHPHTSAHSIPALHFPSPAPTSRPEAPVSSPHQRLHVTVLGS
jgi:hypothetical protein